MTNTQIALTVRGVDKTGSVFSKIASSAARIGKSALAIGAAGVAAAGGAFALAANQLGKLSDIAMQANSTTRDITQLSTALGVLGVKTSSPEQLAMAFQKMTKAVGVTGYEGFKKAITAISEMETAEKRSAAAMATFGKSGLDFMPIIEAVRQNGVQALDDVKSAMPAVSDAAAQAGDDIADSMSLATQYTKTAWLNACGSVAASIEKAFGGDLRSITLKACAVMEYAAKYTNRAFVAAFTNIALAYNALSEDWGKTFSQMGGYLWESIKAYGEAIVGYLANIGRVIVNFGKQAINFITGDGFDAAALFENFDTEAVAARLSERLQAAKDKVTIFDNVAWAEIDTSDLDKNLSEAFAAADKAGQAIVSEHAATTVSNAAGDAAKNINTAMRQARNEMIEGASYRAATMSLRADYGADKTVKAINAVKSVADKIAAATEDTSKALAGIGVLEI